MCAHLQIQLCKNAAMVDILLYFRERPKYPQNIHKLGNTVYKIN